MQVRIIKKYPNRRLYDSAESRYITLSDVRQLVLDGQAFEVIDKKSGENITRCILLQVITEQELRGDAVLSEDFLAQVIRCSRGTPPEMVRTYLEDSLSLFIEQQRQAAATLPDTAAPGPEAAGDLAHYNLERWLELQTAMLRSFQGASRAESGDAPARQTGRSQDG
jgi:polyhydroxyalkanoate synthesis repressor PhaR